MLAEEGEHLAPTIHCLLGPVEWPMPIEDAVAGTVGLRSHPLHCSLGIADHLGVGNTAVGAHFGGDVVRVTLARTLIEIGADREIAVVCQPTGRLDVELAPAREMVDKYYARKRARAGRLGHIRRNRGSIVAFDGDVLASHASVK